MCFGGQAGALAKHRARGWAGDGSWVQALGGAGRLRALPSISRRRRGGAASRSSSGMSLISIRGSLCTGDPLLARGPRHPGTSSGQWPLGGHWQGVCSKHCLLPCRGQPWGYVHAVPSLFIHSGNQGNGGAMPHAQITQLWSQTGLRLAPAPSWTSRRTLGSSLPEDLGFLICKMGTTPTSGIT